jgi:hypothetical protein
MSTVTERQVDGVGKVLITDPGKDSNVVYVEIGGQQIGLPKSREVFERYLEDAKFLLDIMSASTNLDHTAMRHHSFACNHLGIKVMMQAMWLLVHVGGYCGLDNSRHDISYERAKAKVMHLFWK